MTTWAEKIKQNHAALAASGQADIADATGLQAALDIAPQETQDAILKALGLATADKAAGGQALLVAGQLLQTAIKFL